LAPHLELRASQPLRTFSPPTPTRTSSPALFPTSFPSTRAPAAAYAFPPASSATEQPRSTPCSGPPPQELEFWFKSYYRPQPPPPQSTFRFPATLRVLTIGNCNLPDSTVQKLQFPLLKRLGLELVSISECSLHGLITACPALECLSRMPLVFRGCSTKISTMVCMYP
jgi:hypothetical protein